MRAEGRTLTQGDGRRKGIVPMRRLHKLLLAVSITVLAVPAAFGWGGRLHMDINHAAALDVPDDMAAWRDYDNLMALNGVDPDLWKGNDSAEGPRHYIDLERFGHGGATNLPRQLRDALAGPGRKVADGIAPWVIMDVYNRLVAAMASNQWVEAARDAAALGHYVADIHQPLHTTEHYNEKGAHLRWEETMPSYQWRSSLLKPAPAKPLADPWAALLQWIDHAHPLYPQIYQADRDAAALAHDTQSLTYYHALWEKTRELFIGQVELAATDVASLWYTAWIAAGRPKIPAPPQEIPGGSIWVMEPAREPVASEAPFLIFFAAAATLILALSIWKATRRTPDSR